MARDQAAGLVADRAVGHQDGRIGAVFPAAAQDLGASVSTVTRWLRLVGAPWKRGVSAPMRPAAAARRSAGSGNQVPLSSAVVWVRS